jgi:hypothetical protein
LVAVFVVVTGCSYFVDTSTPHGPWKAEPDCGNRYLAAVLDTGWAGVLTAGAIGAFLAYDSSHGDGKTVAFKAGLGVSAVDAAFLPAAVRGWIAVRHCRSGQRAYAGEQRR